MKAKELAMELGVTSRYINIVTKKALESGKSRIVLRGVEIAFRELEGVRGGRAGVVYEYEILDAKVSRKRRRGGSVIKVDELPRVDFANVSLDDKLALVKFIRRCGASIASVAKVYAIDSNLSEKAIYKRLYRWVEAYEKSGKRGLEDKRGGNRVSKIDEQLFMASVSKKGTLMTYYTRYALLEARVKGVYFDVLEPEKSCSISFSGFKRYFNKVKSLPHIKAILRGKDAVDSLEPIFEIRTNYANEMWEIDATKLDIMCKVPVIEGSVNYFRRVESSEYVLKRYSLIAIVDRHSRARVVNLALSDTSYSDVRLLEKAINRLGVPEIIKGDNGKNYVSRHFQEVLEDLGIVYMASNPYSGDEKPFVERNFRTLQHNYLFESLPGFIGHNTSDRVDIENQAAGGSLKGKSGVGTQTHIKEKFMWWWEAEMVIDGLIEHLFSKEMEFHKRVAKFGKSIDNLHILLGKKSKRKVAREGVYYRGKYYLNSELWHYFDIGDSVDVYEEIDDVNRLYARLESGGFIELMSRDIYRISVEEAKEIKKRYKSEKSRIIKDAMRLGRDIRDIEADEIVEKLKGMSSLEEEPKRAIKKEVDEKRLDIDKFLDSLIAG